MKYYPDCIVHYSGTMTRILIPFQTVTVMSYSGTYKDTQGQLYGIRSSAPSVGSACVEYKCSGPLYTQVDTDTTVLDINIKDSSSKFF